VLTADKPARIRVRFTPTAVVRKNEPRETMAEAATLLGARRGIKVVGVDGSGMPDAETAASGGFLPSPHAKLAGPTFQERLDIHP
jgi:hypothetical protein